MNTTSAWIGYVVVAMVVLATGFGAIGPAATSLGAP